MGLIHIMERGGEDYHEYKKALKKAKEAIDTICDLTEDMEDKFSERGGMRRRSYEEYDEMEERGGMRSRRYR